MRLPRDIDGLILAKHLVPNWDYIIARQTGSHLQLRTQTSQGQTVTIPLHKPLKLGMFKGIIDEVASHKRVIRDVIINGL